MSTSFTIVKESNGVRRGVLSTRHGTVETPAFMPIATKGAVKTLTSEELHDAGAQIILSNTYHLMLRPGMEVMKHVGGLHRFMQWDSPILTDSGGFQVYSLSKLRKITDQGVTFRSHIDGSEHLLTPENSLAIQDNIGSDIRMVLDDVRSGTSPVSVMKEAVGRTFAWAQRSKIFLSEHPTDALTFGIVQGGVDPELRRRSTEQLVSLDFDGYAVGGLAVGETEEQMFNMTNAVTSRLPSDRPRYFMGGAKPEQIVQLVTLGVDLFDCVIPTREARHGRLYCWTSNTPAIDGSTKWYVKRAIKNAPYAMDDTAIDPYCSCTTCRCYSRAYLHHLFDIEEPLALRLATQHNIRFYLDVLKKIR